MTQKIGAKESELRAMREETAKKPSREEIEAARKKLETRKAKKSDAVRTVD